MTTLLMTTYVLGVAISFLSGVWFLDAQRRARKRLNQMRVKNGIPPLDPFLVTVRHMLFVAISSLFGLVFGFIIPLTISIELQFRCWDNLKEKFSFLDIVLWK